MLCSFCIFGNVKIKNGVYPYCSRIHVSTASKKTCYSRKIRIFRCAFIQCRWCTELHQQNECWPCLLESFLIQLLLFMTYSPSPSLSLHPWSSASPLSQISFFYHLQLPQHWLLEFWVCLLAGLRKRRHVRSLKKMLLKKIQSVWKSLFIVHFVFKW